ncbi:MAG TPA: bifunctional UDP-N-acetylglucosamine diphosphorylase/glucosamine-1-phosphate N-acetyltransferase GlmU [Solirubrobacteraceae bacterium]|nr:bifunctional UDP-N-acetylglucosamine diphosphorylase/glucosamine-1-phosphate N-acetyltransferase GlmU [Solirubrobacteraceae bacterium]
MEPASATAIILAAGQGTRMRSRTPKVLHDLCGQPMIAWPVNAARAAEIERIVVVDGPDRALDGQLPQGTQIAVQERPLGTADAARAAAAHIGAGDQVVVMSGDAPLVSAALLAGLLRAHRAGGAAATVATFELEDPSGYGRIVRAADGTVRRIVETKVAGDATPEQLAIREVNAGLYVFDGAPLLDALSRVGTANAQGEYYLTEVVVALGELGATVGAHLVAERDQLLGVNDRVQLAQVRAIAQAQILEAHMRAGVSFEQPAGTLVDVGVQIGADTVIEPGCCLRGRTQIGEGCRVGPHATLIDATVHDDARIVHSYVVQAEVGPSANVGPFSYLRPGTVLRERAKAGTFVEIKNSDIGPGAKVPHLSYIGDADVGEGANLGASTITANYDRGVKSRTVIGRRVHTSVDTTLVAPVTLGDDAYTGAGSVINEDVPEGALGISRPPQVNVEGFAARRAAEGARG